MSEAENLLNDMGEESTEIGDFSLSTFPGSNTSAIIINPDRTLSVPISIRKIGMRGDTNVETIRFICPRYNDGVDLSTLSIYINYKRSDGTTGQSSCERPSLIDNDSRMMFEWNISKSVTAIAGYLSITVCMKKMDSSLQLSYTLKTGNEYMVSGVGSGNVQNTTIPTYLGKVPVTEIADNAFENNNQIETVTISNGITRIGKAAFKNCSNLKSIVIPTSVTTIDESAFEGCTRLEKVEIPGSVTILNANAFKNCYSLQTVKIFNGCINIGANVFENCSSLSDISIPNSVKQIGKYAFAGCAGLSIITLPNAVTYIGDYAFNECRMLNDVNMLSSSPSTLGTSAFPNNMLLRIYVPTDSETTYKNKWSAYKDNITLQTDELQYDNGVVTGLSNQVTNVYIPSEYTLITEEDNPETEENEEKSTTYTVTGIKDYAFQSDIMESVTIPNTVTTIGEYAFHGCSKLTTVDIPASVTTIKKWAFHGTVPNLKRIRMLGSTPPKLEDNNGKVFNMDYTESIIVPKGSINNYFADEQWSKYSAVISEEPLGDEGIITDAEETFTFTNRWNSDICSDLYVGEIIDYDNNNIVEELGGSDVVAELNSKIDSFNVSGVPMADGSGMAVVVTRSMGDQVFVINHGKDGATGPQGPKGDTGAKIVSTELINSTDSGNEYEQTFDDGSTSSFVAPAGPQGVSIERVAVIGSQGQDESVIYITGAVLTEVL